VNQITFYYLYITWSMVFCHSDRKQTDTTTWFLTVQNKMKKIHYSLWVNYLTLCTTKALRATKYQSICGSLTKTLLIFSCCYCKKSENLAKINRKTFSSWNAFKSFVIVGVGWTKSIESHSSNTFDKDVLIKIFNFKIFTNWTGRGAQVVKHLLRSVRPWIQTTVLSKI
jgi:hypothetical protein